MNPKIEMETVDPPGIEQNEDPPDSELICKRQKCEKQSEDPLMREVDMCWNVSEKRNKDPPSVSNQRRYCPPPLRQDPP